MNFSQAFNPIGAITGVLAGTLFIFSGVELSSQQIASMKVEQTYSQYLRKETLRVVNSYLVIGCLAFLFAFLSWRSRFPVAEVNNLDPFSGNSSFKDLLCYPHFLTAICAQFMYVGAQVGTWSYFIQYVQEYTHSPRKLPDTFSQGLCLHLALGVSPLRLLCAR